MNDYVMTAVDKIIYKDSLDTELSESDISLLNSFPAEEVVLALRVLFDKIHDDVVKSRSFHAILSIQKFDKVKFLIDIFEESSIDWQIAYCRALAQFHDSRAITKLCRVLLENTNADTRYVAAESLSEIGDSTATAALEYAQENDTGEDYEGFLVADMARQALLKIKNRTE